MIHQAMFQVISIKILGGNHSISYKGSGKTLIFVWITGFSSKTRFLESNIGVFQENCDIIIKNIKNTILYGKFGGNSCFCRQKLNSVIIFTWELIFNNVIWCKLTLFRRKKCFTYKIYDTRVFYMIFSFVGRIIPWLCIKTEHYNFLKVSSTKWHLDLQTDFTTHKDKPLETTTRLGLDNTQTRFNLGSPITKTAVLTCIQLKQHRYRFRFQFGWFASTVADLLLFIVIDRKSRMNDKRLFLALLPGPPACSTDNAGWL